jgi:hypothetical protein
MKTLILLTLVFGLGMTSNLVLATWETDLDDAIGSDNTARVLDLARAHRAELGTLPKENQRAVAALLMDSKEPEDEKTGKELLEAMTKGDDEDAKIARSLVGVGS